MALKSGKIVGWFRGRMEFGPRALGHRSILADPRNPKMKDIINEKVKNREPFRPFAPSVLEEASSDYFELFCPSPFMLLTAKVKEDKRSMIPAVTHVDGTARIQTVNKEDDLVYYNLIKKFAELTNVPVLLNTSFNIKGEPIVCTPAHAYECLKKTGIDLLVMENFIIEKTQRTNHG